MPVFSFWMFSGLMMVCKFWKCDMSVENQCFLSNWAMNENCKISQYRDLTFARFHLFMMVCKVYTCEMPVENQCFFFFQGIDKDRMLKQSRYMKFAVFYQFFLVFWKGEGGDNIFWLLCDNQTCFTLKNKNSTIYCCKTIKVFKHKVKEGI